MENKMVNYNKFLKVISDEVGLSIDTIKEKNPTELKEYLTKKTHKKFKVTSEAPTIGRGCIISDFVATEELDQEIDLILKK